MSKVLPFQRIPPPLPKAKVVQQTTKPRKQEKCDCDNQFKFPPGKYWLGDITQFWPDWDNVQFEIMDWSRIDVGFWISFHGEKAFYIVALDNLHGRSEANKKFSLFKDQGLFPEEHVGDVKFPNDYLCIVPANGAWKYRMLPGFNFKSQGYVVKLKKDATLSVKDGKEVKFGPYRMAPYNWFDGAFRRNEEE